MSLLELKGIYEPTEGEFIGAAAIGEFLVYANSFFRGG